MTLHDDAQDLMIQAQEALDEGDSNQARELYQRVVEVDETNVEAWIALTKLVDDPNEKRICAMTVLQLDDNNMFARQVLADLDAKAKKEERDEFAPGISRSLVRRTILLGTLFVLGVCALTFLLRGAILAPKEAERANLTQVAVASTRTKEALDLSVTEAIVTQTAQVINATETAVASITPTLTPTETLIPSFTPPPTETQVSFRVLDAPPETIVGSVVAWGDRDPNSDGFVDMQRIPVGTGVVTKLGNLVVRNPSVDSNFTRIVYQTFGSLGARSLEVANANDPTLGESLDARWIGEFELTDPNFPTLNADGTVLVFVGTSIDNNMTDLYLINFLTNELRRMTNGVGTFGAPALSPDGTRLVVPLTDTGGTDLVLITVADGTMVKLTEDGSTTVESSPSWSPVDNLVVYSAYTTNPSDNDIFVMRILDASVTIEPLIVSTDDELYPVYSPSGRYVAYASNPTGNYNIFISEPTVLTVWQLTTSEFDFFPTTWLP